MGHDLDCCNCYLHEVYDSQGIAQQAYGLGENTIDMLTRPPGCLPVPCTPLLCCAVLCCAVQESSSKDFKPPAASPAGPTTAVAGASHGTKQE
jgi:hypothetical protein